MLRIVDADSGDRRWEVSTKDLQYRGNGDCATLNDSGDTVVAATSDGHVRVWDSPGSLRNTLQVSGNGDTEMRLAINSTGTRLATISREEGETHDNLKRWDLTTGKLLGESPLPFYAKKLLFMPDGKRILTIANHLEGKTKLQLCDWTTGQQVLYLTTDHADCAALSPDGRWLVAGGETAQVRAWEGDPLFNTLSKHRCPPQSMQVSTDGKWLLTATAHDSTHRTRKYPGGPEAYVWDIEKRRICFELVGEASVRSSIVRMRPAGDLLVAEATQDGIVNKEVVEVWSVPQGKLLHRIRLPFHRKEDEYNLSIKVGPLCFTRDGRLLIGSSLNSLHLYDPTTGKELHRLCERHDEDLMYVDTSDDGKLIAAAFRHGEDFEQDFRRRVWDAQTGRELDASAWTHGEPGNSNNVGPRFEKRNVEVGIFHGKAISIFRRAIRVNDAATGKLLRTVHAHEDGITCWSLTPDHEYLITGGNDKLIKFFKLQELLAETSE